MTTNRSGRASGSRGNSKNRSSASVSTAPSDPVLARLAEAETLHQRATRRHDDSSLDLFEAAAVAFRDALSGRGARSQQRQQGGLVIDAAGGAPGAATPRPLPPLKQASALFGLAEAFQGWASRLVERAEAQPSDALTRSVEATAAANATTLLAQAVGAFAAASGAAEEIVRNNNSSSSSSSSASASASADEKTTTATARHLLSDSIVNAGNALTEWAALLSKAAGWPEEVRERFKFATSAEDASAGPVELLLLQNAPPSPSPSSSAVEAAAAALGLNSVPQQPAALLSAARALVSRAVDAYQSAMALPSAAAGGDGNDNDGSGVDDGNDDRNDNDDADTRLNLADALVQAAELSDSLEEARRLYERAFESFEGAVARASSEEGDDLPSLLSNWGVALHSAFARLHGEEKKEQGEEGSTAPFAPLRLLDAAEARLRESASFGRGDTAPLCALGDVLCDRAAFLTEESAAAAEAGAAAAAAAAEAGAAAAATEVAAAEAAKRELYERAIQDGYSAALAIDRRCAAASAGKGDALLALSRIAAAAEAVGEEASPSSIELARAALASYSAALAEAPRLGGLDERGSVIYNAACAAARSSRGSAEAGGGEQREPAGVDEARRRVRALVAGGAVSALGVLRDDDLACLHGEAWLLDVARAEEKVVGSSSSEAMRE